MNDYVGTIAILLAIVLFCWGIRSLAKREKTAVKRPWHSDADVKDDFWDDAARNAGSM